MTKIQIEKPIIILVNTQLPENLGASARAMLNFNFEKIRIVSPKFELENKKIIPVSAGADLVIKNIKKFDSLEDAIKDLNFLIACTARKRFLDKKTLAPKLAVKEIIERTINNNKIGIIFGPENAGLTNKHLSMVDALLKINSNPNFKSLNLSHAIMIFCYEWTENITKGKTKFSKSVEKELALKKDFLNFFNRLEILMEKNGFIKTQDRKDIIILKLRNIFKRMSLTKNELNTLMGLISSLSHKK